VARVRFFAQARDAAGCREADVEGDTVDEVIALAVDRFGPALGAVLPTSTVWVNGERVEGSSRVDPGDEIAVLPPVSGG
jgi:molybdopterin synthase catalytic subunit/molybdopterin synthase sulfur carrier subunit